MIDIKAEGVPLGRTSGIIMAAADSLHPLVARYQAGRADLERTCLCIEHEVRTAALGCGGNWKDIRVMCDAATQSPETLEARKVRLTFGIKVGPTPEWTGGHFILGCELGALMVEYQPWEV